jgi:hypothetical protein
MNRLPVIENYKSEPALNTASILDHYLLHEIVEFLIRIPFLRV